MQSTNSSFHFQVVVARAGCGVVCGSRNKSTWASNTKWHVGQLSSHIRNSPGNSSTARLAVLAGSTRCRQRGQYSLDDSACTIRGRGIAAIATAPPTRSQSIGRNCGTTGRRLQHPRRARFQSSFAGHSGVHKTGTF